MRIALRSTFQKCQLDSSTREITNNQRIPSFCVLCLIIISLKMSQRTPKTPKKSLWVLCEKCSSNILNKDSDTHSNDCPPAGNPTYGYIQNGVLFGNLDVKSNETVGKIDKRTLNYMVFLSQAAIELCSLSIGEWACVYLADNSIPIVRRVWPTTEKTSTSVLMTKSALELCSGSPDSRVEVFKLEEKDVIEAGLVTIVSVDNSKPLEVTPDLSNRIHKTFEDMVFCVGNRIGMMYFGRKLKFEIKAINSSDSLEESFNKLNIRKPVLYRTTGKTIWMVFKDNSELRPKRKTPTIGGLQSELQDLRDQIICFNKDKTASVLSNSVLLYGISGTGKTMLAKTAAKELNLHTVTICPSDVRTSENPEETIKRLFQQAKERAPSIIILDKVDVLCPCTASRTTDSVNRLTSTLMTALDDLYYGSSSVFVIGTTSKPDFVDPDFRVYGRFSAEMEIPVPDLRARRDILQKFLDSDEGNGWGDGSYLEEVAAKTHGFVGADLASLCSSAWLEASRRQAEHVCLEHFKEALKKIRPSAMREVQVEVADVKWSDIGGQQHIKKILKNAIEWPLKHPETLRLLKIKPTKGVLMYGPPGCSKTMIAKALATESGRNFISITGSDLFNKYVGESEKAVRDVFRKARLMAPSIIFFDEIDALGSERSSSASGVGVQDRVLTQLLTEMDGVSPMGDVMILAATNRPDMIDKALIRQGRLNRIVYVELPDAATRREILKLEINQRPVEDKESVIEELVVATERYSGSEVVAVCNQAATAAMDENVKTTSIDIRHFREALRIIRPMTPQSLIETYERYASSSKWLG